MVKRISSPQNNNRNQNRLITLTFRASPNQEKSPRIVPTLVLRKKWNKFFFCLFFFFSSGRRTCTVRVRVLLSFTCCQSLGRTFILYSIRIAPSELLNIDLRKGECKYAEPFHRSKRRRRNSWSFVFALENVVRQGRLVFGAVLWFRTGWLPEKVDRIK